MQKRIVELGIALAMVAAAGCSSPIRKAADLAQTGQRDQARQVLLEAIASDSANPRLYYALAVLADTTGLTSEAIRSYRTVLRLTPEDLPARQRLALLYARVADSLLAAGNRVAARDSLRIALRIDSTCAACWEKLGDSYVAIAYSRTALNHYRKAFDLDPGERVRAKMDSIRQHIALAEELVRRGQEAYNSKEWRSAESLFAHALELDAENDDARYGRHMSRGMQLYRKGRKSELWDAISEFGHAAGVKPTRAEPHYWLARCYEKKDRNEFVNAIDEYQKAAELEPESPIGKESARKARELRELKEKLDRFWGR